MSTETKVLRIAEVLERIGISESGLWAKVKDKQFPQPIALGPKARGWLAHEVEAWIQYRASCGKRSFAWPPPEDDQVALGIVRSQVFLGPYMTDATLKRVRRALEAGAMPALDDIRIELRDDDEAVRIVRAGFAATEARTAKNKKSR